MPVKHHDYTKQEALEKLKRYLLELRQPITQAELARHFGCNRSTIGRWIEELERQKVPIIREDDLRISINRDAYVTHVTLNRDESVMTMIALRLMQQHMHHPNQHTVETMHKIGVALRAGIAPEVGDYVLNQTGYQRQELDPTNKHESQKTLEIVAQAWFERRKIRWRYTPLRSSQAFEELFHPYLVEPIALGGSTYIVGYSELVNAIRARKLERIRRLPVIEDDSYQIQPDFDPTLLFKRSWGIWFDQDEQPTTVMVRFTGLEAKKRLRENRWHPSEQITEDAQGNVIWQAEIDEWKAIVSWVRSWGASCEVLQPQALRDEIIAGIRRASKLYGLGNNTHPNDNELFRNIFGGE